MLKEKDIQSALTFDDAQRASSIKVFSTLCDLLCGNSEDAHALRCALYSLRDAKNVDDGYILTSFSYARDVCLEAQRIKAEEAAQRLRYEEAIKETCCDAAEKASKEDDKTHGAFVIKF